MHAQVPHAVRVAGERLIRHLSTFLIQTKVSYSMIPFIFLPENTKCMYFGVIRHESEWTNKNSTVVKSMVANSCSSE